MLLRPHRRTARVAITDALIDHGHLLGADGTPDPDRGGDRLPGRDDVDHRLGDAGAEALAGLGVTVVDGPIRCCVDRTEHRHHLSGALGREVLAALRRADRVRPTRNTRALTVTDSGRRAPADHLELEWPPPHGPHRALAPA